MNQRESLNKLIDSMGGEGSDAWQDLPADELWALAWQAATEQGVGETVDGDPLPCPFCGDKPTWEFYEDPSYPQVECRNMECPIGLTNDLVSLNSWNTRSHPPKPTGGGVPDEVMARIKNLLLALGHQGVTLNPDEPSYDVGEWGIKEAQELYDLLATQQPPEQE